MNYYNYHEFIRRLLEKWKRRRDERRMSLDRTFFVFAILLFMFGMWLSSALLLLDKSFPANGQSAERIITPSPDGYSCNNLALNFWPFISDKRKRRLPSKLISKWFFVLILLSAGDVHPNPGPGLTERKELFITKQPHVRLGLVFGSREVQYT